MSWKRIAVSAAFFLASIAVHPSQAQDVTPTVSPDRIDDVPDADTFEKALQQFDNFSWRAFIALNWPALPDDASRGQPDRTKTPSDPGPRVWETYKANYEVFASGAPTPSKWESFDGTNPCGGSVTNRTKTLSAFSHFADYNQAAFSLAGLANPLVDQNRAYTRYEVRLNREEFDTIVDNNNKWYIKQNLPNEGKPGTFQNGSIEVKAAWRILKPGDDIKRQRFYITKAVVFDPDATKKAGSVVCNEREIALVGFHIAVKTPMRPQWIWSSFEHIDNVPPKGDEPDAKNVPTPYSYNSGGPPNAISPRQPPKMISDSNPPNSNPDPMQVLRLQPIQPGTMQLNRTYWNLLKGTVWANYMLIMTQWPSNPGTPSIKNGGAPAPLGTASTLANTTMETYQQRNGSSCMECHNQIANAHGKDFVAFMAFDATDPPQKMIAAMAASGFEAVGVAPAAAGRNTLSAAKKIVLPDLLRSALDDDPSVKALVRVLRSE